MEIRQKTTKQGNKWQLVNEYWQTSYAWGHKTTLIRNGYDFEPHTVRYHNRTWECYTYQTCMSGAVETVYRDELKIFIYNYKNKNNIDRFKKGQKEKAIAEFEETDIAKDLKELKKAITDRNFD